MRLPATLARLWGGYAELGLGVPRAGTGDIDVAWASQTPSSLAIREDDRLWKAWQRCKGLRLRLLQHRTTLV